MLVRKECGVKKTRKFFDSGEWLISTLIHCNEINSSKDKKILSCLLAIPDGIDIRFSFLPVSDIAKQKKGTYSNKEPNYK